MKLQRVEKRGATGAGVALDGYVHWCPGCDEAHFIADTWKFDGNMDLPTFTPSVKLQHGSRGQNGVCHYFLTHGELRFCSDSTHHLKGCTIPLPDLQEPWA